MQIKEVLSFLDNEFCEYRFIGNKELYINKFCSLQEPGEEAVMWIKPENRLSDDLKVKLNNLQRILIIGSESLEEEIPNACWLIVESPKVVYFKIVKRFFVKKTVPVISKDSIVETQKIGKNVSIGHHCYIGAEVDIAENVIIEHNVTINAPCKIGENTIIHSGVVIGTDGFGYYKEDDVCYKVPHLGGVVIDKDVEIGANTCVDRGTIDNTIIGARVKIDNLCHIGHNVQIEEDSLVIALSVLGGSCKLKRASYIAPGGIVKNQVTVGEHSLVGMGAVVTKDIEDNKVVAGVPAKVIKENT